ncbi:MAG: GtrA family protein [Lachnospiraceae bacterium]|jgi:putative flippase GtrA|nr:GtrA family protein [Lachnospiraceae bacterium]
MIKALLIRYKSFIMYAVFGVFTTLVNMLSYYLCFNTIGISNVPSTIIAWILAVVFAFITNKLWVFESKSFDSKILKREIPAFFGARIVTGILDVVIMYIAVDVMFWNSTVWKMISNIFIIIINYIASKLIIFQKG